MLTSPFAAIHQSSLVVLIGADAQIDQDDYSASVALDLVAACGAPAGKPISGEILGILLISSESGEGAVLSPNGVLFFFSADPAISAGDTAVLGADRQYLVGQVEIETTDWQADTGCASCMIHTKPIAFPAVTSLYACWHHDLTTAYNSAAGDDEALHLRIFFRRDS